MVAHAHLLNDIPIGTGYAAWDLCSRTMPGGDDFERVRENYTAPKLKQLPWIWHIDHQALDHVEVRTDLPFLAHARVAIYRPGLGCTLIVPGSTAAQVRAQDFRVRASAAPRADHWPVGEATAQSGRLSRQQHTMLNTHADHIFGEAELSPRNKQNALAFLVAINGHLVYERYASGYTRQQPQLGWSMSKSLTTLIAGLMERDGLLSLDAPVGLQRWANSPKAAITWRQLLNMAPGLAWSENYDGHSDVTEMLFSQSDQGAWAAERPLTAQPGTVFNYSTGFSNIAMLRMRELLGGSHQAVYDYYQGRLFAPLGIREGVIEPDASGTPVGGARGMLRPVDWLRLGQLVANGGTWQGQTLVARSYLDFMQAPSPASAEYGAGLWRHSASAIPAQLRARLPSDLVWFAGHMGQFMAIVPSKNIVALRMGVAFDKDDARTRFFAAVADLANLPLPPAPSPAH